MFLRRGRQLRLGLTLGVRSGIAAVACIALFSRPAGSQQRLEIPSAERCPDCTLRLERVAVLGDREGPGGVGYSTTVTRDSRGHDFLSHIYSRHEILVFDPGGRSEPGSGEPGRARVSMRLQAS